MIRICMMRKNLSKGERRVRIFEMMRIPTIRG